MCRRQQTVVALNRKRSVALLSFLLLAAGQAPLSAQEMPAWKFRAGSSFTLEHVQQQKLQVEIKDKVEKSELTTTWITRIDVQKVSDKDIVVDQTIVSVSAQGNLNKENFDVWAGKMKGGKFRVTLSPAGRVLAFEGYEDFIRKIEGVKHHADHAARVLITEQALGQNLEDMLGFLPTRPTKAKETWQRETVESVAPFGSFKVTTDYVASGRRDGADVIAFSMRGSYVLPKTDQAVLRVLKGTIKPDVGKGEVLFDAHKGMLIRGQKQLRFEGELTLEAAPERTLHMGFAGETNVTWRIVDR